MRSTPLKGLTDKGRERIAHGDNMKKVIYRDSISGRIITQQQAVRNPDTTERQHVYVPAPKPKK
jgi:hypothetical protein